MKVRATITLSPLALRALAHRLGKKGRATREDARSALLRAMRAEVQRGIDALPYAEREEVGLHRDRSPHVTLK